MTTVREEIGDQKELERIHSVAQNAYQYMDRNGQLRLNATRDEDGWEDLGSNISPDMVAEMHRLNHPLEPPTPTVQLERE
jgi:hypothetical protein